MDLIGYLFIPKEAKLLGQEKDGAVYVTIWLLVMLYAVCFISYQSNLSLLT